MGRKLSWECDNCGARATTDEFPTTWIHLKAMWIAYFFVIHDSIVYDKISRNLDPEKAKRFIDEIASGKRTKFNIFFGKGTFCGLGSSHDEYKIIVEEIFYSSEEPHNNVYQIGACIHLHSGWIGLGTYAKEKFFLNPSRRKEIWINAPMSFL